MVQGTFDDLGTPLSTVTFVVVDLETTGGSPAECGITEIGAVKVRGGEVVGEFQTLVNPGGPIPPFISVLTGITDAMVAAAPRIEAALPAFLEFARGSVLVAHNARFDISFLKAAARRTDHEWPGFRVVDTVHLARQLVRRDEVPNHRLGTLARLFRASTTPDHRALHDARATVDVLHALLERVGTLGVHSLEELLDFTSRVCPARRRKRHLADGLPDAPGVYLFKDGQGRVLYVGTSVSIRTRVRTYFTASEHRSRMGEMVRIAESVSPIVCATTLEAEVRELRLIAAAQAALQPALAPPRAGAVGQAHRRAVPPAVGRARGRRRRRPLRRAVRLAPRRRAPPSPPCTRCCRCASAWAAVRHQAPVAPASSPRWGGAARRAPARSASTSTPRSSTAPPSCSPATPATSSTALRARMAGLAAQQRFEDARRPRPAGRLRRAARPLAAPRPPRPQRELVAARRPRLGGWEVVCVRYGRLAGHTSSPRGADPMPYIDALQASAEVVAPPRPPAPAATPEETENILRWLESPGVRLVEVDGDWTCPVGRAAAVRAELEPLESARREVAGFAGVR